MKRSDWLDLDIQSSWNYVNHMREDIELTIRGRCRVCAVSLTLLVTLNRKYESLIFDSREDAIQDYGVGADMDFEVRQIRIVT